jgi:hypothetical protein
VLWWRSWSPIDAPVPVRPKGESEDKNFCAAGRRNPLKTLKTAKEIKGYQSFFLCWIWLDID